MHLKRHGQVSREIKGISTWESTHCSTLVFLKAIKFFVLEFKSDFNLKCLTGCSVLITFLQVRAPSFPAKWAVFAILLFYKKLQGQEWVGSNVVDLVLISCQWIGKGGKCDKKCVGIGWASMYIPAAKRTFFKVLSYSPLLVVYSFNSIYLRFRCGGDS